MPTDIRPELSKKSKYWIPRERYFELKHFCFQYPDWKKYVKNVTFYPKNTALHSIEAPRMDQSIVEDISIQREKWLSKIELVEKTAKDTDEVLWTYILKAVTENLSCNYLITVLDMPCSKDTFYALYRKFFWLLDRS